MKKLIAVLMVAGFAGTALPSFAQTPSTPPAATPMAPAGKAKAANKKASHKKQKKNKTESKN